MTKGASQQRLAHTVSREPITLASARAPARSGAARRWMMMSLVRFRSCECSRPHPHSSVIACVFMCMHSLPLAEKLHGAFVSIHLDSHCREHVAAGYSGWNRSFCAVAWAALRVLVRTVACVCVFDRRCPVNFIQRMPASLFSTIPLGVLTCIRLHQLIFIHGTSPCYNNAAAVSCTCFSRGVPLHQTTDNLILIDCIYT